jgi:hypothetical protein
MTQRIYPPPWLTAQHPTERSARFLVVGDADWWEATPAAPFGEVIVSYPTAAQEY